jgi:RNA polymerase-interacting CarD/CdnL/TRCF family regulator
MGVDVKEVAGQKLSFVTLKREEDGALVLVPEQKVHSIGLRKIAEPGDIKKVFDFLKSDSDKATLDWKQRARTNVDRMNQGGIVGLAEVVKGLAVLSELRPLPNKERELYDTARHLLVTELAASLNASECDAEDAVDIVLFPPGRERPKRSIEEFQSPLPAEDDLGLELEDEALLRMQADLEVPPEESAPEEQEAAEADGDAEAEEPPPPKKARGAAKAEKPKKAAAAAPKAKKKAPATAKPAAGASSKKKPAPSKSAAAAAKTSRAASAGAKKKKG